MRWFLAAALTLLLAGPAAAQIGGQPPYIDNAMTGGAAGSGMARDGSNAEAGTTKDNLGLVRDLVVDFAAVCDGTTDDAAAFAAATAWLATAPNQRLVTIPAKTCATSATVTLGDGRQQSTTTTALVTGTPSTVAVASCSGVVAGDAVGIKRDVGTVFTTSVTSCVGTTLTLASPYSGGNAASGNAVFTGKISTYNGGGFVGYGAGGTSAEWPAGRDTSTIKYIGATAPTTTLGATASATNLTLTVASIANIALGTPVGVTLDNGRIWWTWASETPTGVTVKIANEIPSTATLGNAVLIASNPVLRVNGPILNPVIQSVMLDANGLAAIGMDVIHPNGGEFQGANGVRTKGYLGIGHNIRSAEFHPQTAVGVGDNYFKLSAVQPNNTKTIGCWYRGTSGQTVAFSRNHFIGGNCTMGGNDVTAAAIRVEFIDNNTFEKPYTSVNGASTSGAGLYRQPSVNRTLFPNENEYVAPAFIGGITTGSATGSTLGVEHITGYSIYDGAGVPSSTTLSGSLMTGLPFGLATPQEHFAGLVMTRASAAQITIATGMAADSTGNTILALQTSCTASLNTSGNQGIDSGAKAANTWYAVFLIGPTSAGVGSCIFSATTSAVVPTPTLPAGYLYYAYVGRFKTDAASDISAFTLLPRGQFYIDATGASTYTPGASGFRPRAVRLLACGGGGGGGSGGVQVSGTAVSGGTGGSGGGCMDVTYSREQLASTIAVTVGAGGAAVNPPAGPNAAGTVGNSGAPTFFGASAGAAIAYGGAGCAGDGGRLNAASASGGAGAGAINTTNVSACTNGALGVAGAGQTGGVAGSSGVFGTFSVTPGAGSAGGGGAAAGGVGTSGGTAQGRFGCAGGGSGGGQATGPAGANGTTGGAAVDATITRGAGGSSGTPAGGSPAAPLAPWLPGSSAGGGYSDNDASPGSGAGGTGAQCAGGGGGGSTLNTFVAGAGGKGGDGYAFVWELR